MTDQMTDWEARLAQLWALLDELDEQEFLRRMEALAAERSPDDPVALFERASAQDSTGHSDRAVPLYRHALQGGLEGHRRRRAVIQMASSLRNLGQAGESVSLLAAERAAGSDELDDAVAAFLALALVDTGREREAVALSLTARPATARIQPVAGKLRAGDRRAPAGLTTSIGSTAMPSAVARAGARSSTCSRSIAAPRSPSIPSMPLIRQRRSSESTKCAWAKVAPARSQSRNRTCSKRAPMKSAWRRLQPSNMTR